MHQKMIPKRLSRIEDGFLSVVQLVQLMSGEVDKLTKRVADVETRIPAKSPNSGLQPEAGHE